MGIISERIDGKLIHVTIKSSNLKGATYDTEEKTLTVTFTNGVKYEYYDVPWKVFTQLRSDKSQGVFFSKNIRNSYKFKKL